MDTHPTKHYLFVPLFSLLSAVHDHKHCLKLVGLLWTRRVAAFYDLSIIITNPKTGTVGDEDTYM